MKLGETVTFDFITVSPSGVHIAKDTDSTPLVEVFKGSGDAPILNPSVAKRTGRSGHYSTTFDLDPAVGFENEQSFNVMASGTIDGSEIRIRVAQFVLELGDGYVPSDQSEFVFEL